MSTVGEEAHYRGTAAVYLTLYEADKMFMFTVRALWTPQAVHNQ